MHLSVFFFHDCLRSSLYSLNILLLNSQNPEKIRKAQAEIDAVLGQGAPTYESVKKLEYVCSKDIFFDLSFGL